MEKRNIIKLERKAQYGILSNLKTIFTSVMRMNLGHLQETISVDILASSYLPYEASRTYREIMTKFECTRANFIVEARRQSFHAL